MSGFKMDDYVDVAQRIADFYERYPDGRLTSMYRGPVEIDGKTFVIVEAQAYRDPDDELPGDGLAWEPVPGPTQFTRDSELMNAQTAAWGRAIVALGFQTKKIASKQEVQARNGQQPVPTDVKGDGQTGDAASAYPGDPHGLQKSRADAVQPGQEVFTFGKHKGSKVSDVPTSYLEWWLTSDSAKADKNQGLRAAVEFHLGLAPAASGGGSDMDDIPFAPSAF